MNPKLALFLALLSYASPIARAGESSFALPRNVAIARLVSEAAKVLVPGKIEGYVPFTHFDFRKTGFAESGPYVPGAFSFDVKASIDDAYTCEALVAVKESGEVALFLPAKDGLCVKTPGVSHD